ncbi:MAG TPA: SLC13 family permease [Ignavibacteriaceae bacterium]|nr:SLC13 family permease [Ignavibacteriaceae bacterium]
MISFIILLIVFSLIAIRQIGNVKLHIWQIMLGGAVVVLFSGQISFPAALHAINFDVIVFLFGMFIVGRALEESGYLSHLSYLLFKRAQSLDIVILIILFVMGITSSFLMNDTVAIIGTPVVLLVAKQNKIESKILLLALAFAVTIGSVMSPIGNPQNLIIAVNGGVKNSFVVFLKFLFIPTILNLIFAYLLLKLFFKKEFKKGLKDISPPIIIDKKLAILSKISLVIIFILVMLKIVLISFHLKFDFKLTDIAVVAALPIVLFGSRRFEILKRIDWHTLVFFAAMFVLMQSVWNSGIFQKGIDNSDFNLKSTLVILGVSAILSQLISNVPLVVLYLPLLMRLGIGTRGMLALSAGSTIAGNLFILGAASNIIIIQTAEKRTGDTLTFIDFAKIGVPLTIVNLLVYYLFLH